MKRPLPTCSLLFILTLLVCQVAYGQNPPVFSQFFANPYQFNPSYVANNGYAEANLFYRRQWLGVDNTPTVGAVNIQAPVGRNVSLGLTAYNDKSILLSSTSVLATFGYRIRFAQAHNLNFGLSGGVGFNSFDYSSLENTNDPALANVSQNNTFVNGQFGFNYQFKNFNIGFALPRLFDSKPNSAQSFNEVKTSKFDNRFGSASYTFNLGAVKVCPYVIYRSIDQTQHQWEGLLQVTIKDVIWIGGSYRDGYGATGFIGLNLKGLLRIGYAYERPTGDIKSVAGGTHEIYMGARLSRNNREESIFAEKEVQDSVKAATAVAKKTTPSSKDTTTAAEAPPAKQDKAKRKNQEAINQPVTQQPITEVQQDANKTGEATKTTATPQEQAPAQKAPADEQIAEEHALGHYLILGVYQQAENAKKQLSKLREKGLNPAILYQSEKNYYYVYIYYSTNRQEVIDKWKIIRRQNQYFGAWIYTAVEK
ncbi:MAG TPA: PorP/SprF family type IX secretion system membrane protein [Ohtaekwangia sp.]|uniref:PorP/SprF family type IX secretion system membrane protein n=1 Tax=Ohtaekwangia sp. TaxID=2066019 RepID=UPI002F929C6D